LRDGLQVVAAGDHDDGDVGRTLQLADGAADGKAVEQGHVDVEQHQVGRIVAETGYGRAAVARFHRVEADLGQHFQHQQAHDGIVIGHQHGTAFG